MASAGARNAARAGDSLIARTSIKTLQDPAHQLGLKSLLSQTYGKPVELHLRPIKEPYHDVEILASFVTQQLKDRKSQVRRVIRNATWDAKLPSQSVLAALHQERQRRHEEEKPFTLAQLTHGPSPTKYSRVINELELSQVTSVRVQAGGRLSKRITANQAESKFARRGATNKAAAHYVRGFRKSTITYATGTGKRRIGAFGIKAHLGHA